ncbi:MAG: class I SAM-dependent methyltransferase [Candidatus Niyogibacteria bacterium]|nr:class I SAM-dependent methyltransferase [Candidatus Niyogibacteria bacterium]
MYNDAYFSKRLSWDARRNGVWKELARFFLPWFPNPANRIIEIGAGHCAWINAIQAPERYAVDAANIVRTYAGAGVTVIVGDAADLAFAKDASVDVVLASNLFEHLNANALDVALQEIFRALRCQGRLFIVQPNFRYAWREYFDDYTHQTIFTDRGLCGKLESVGFRVVRCWPRLLPFSFKSTALPTPWFLVRAYLYSPWRPGAKQTAIIAEKIQ